jgi:hypothetical protein
LPLEPFRSQPILVIGPFSFGDDAAGRRLQRHRPKSEFVKGQHRRYFDASGSKPPSIFPYLA